MTSNHRVVGLLFITKQSSGSRKAESGNKLLYLLLFSLVFDSLQWLHWSFDHDLVAVSKASCPFLWICTYMNLQNTNGKFVLQLPALETSSNCRSNCSAHICSSHWFLNRVVGKLNWSYWSRIRWAHSLIHIQGFKIPLPWAKLEESHLFCSVFVLLCVYFLQL